LFSFLRLSGQKCTVLFSRKFDCFHPYMSYHSIYEFVPALEFCKCCSERKIKKINGAVPTFYNDFCTCK
uniref:Ovule protein n=1 Tax=Brugia timori TaxID=42155 RepID=A0A0R3R9E4_9BILA